MSYHTAQHESAEAESKTPLRAVGSAGAVCLGALILIEPMVLDTSPGLQLFQAVFVIWFWALFMCANTSGRRNSGK